MNPLPYFDTIRSMIELQEHTRSKEVPISDTTLLSSENFSTTTSPPAHCASSNSGNRGHRNGRRGGNRNRQTNSLGNSSPATNHFGHTHAFGPNYSRSSSQPQNLAYPPWGFWTPQWVMPPCPRPSTSITPWTARPPPSSQAGLLGLRPIQAQNFYMGAPAASYGYVPTDIDQAMNALSLAPSDEQFYMDTGASSHMTNSTDILSN